jgi:hypothetical protein
MEYKRVRPKARAPLSGTNLVAAWSGSRSGQEGLAQGARVVPARSFELSLREPRPNLEPPDPQSPDSI